MSPGSGRAPEEARARNGARWLLLALPLPWLAYWWPVLTGREQLFNRDIGLFALPSKAFWIERIAQGELPAWTPHVAAGMPFLADISNQVFYPLNLIFLVEPDLGRALSLFMVAHLLIGMAGMYALARSLDLGTPAAAWAGLCFGASGYALSIMDNMNYLPAVAWAPVGLAAFQHGLRGGGARCTAAAGACLAAMLLAGDSLNPVIAGGLCVLLAAGDWRDGARRGRRIHTLAHLAGTAVMAGLLGAVQILPGLELVSESVRQDGMALDHRQLWSFPPARTLELVQPFLFGTKFPESEFLGPDLYPHRHAPWVDSVYLGLVPAVLAAAAVASRTRRAWPWLLAGAAALLLGYGRHTPVFEAFTASVPFTDTHRYPEKLLFWVQIALLVLAAIGLDGWLAPGRRTAPGWLAASWGRLAATAAVLATGWLLVDLPIRLWLGERAGDGSSLWSRIFAADLSHTGGLLLHSGLVTAALLAAVWGARRHWRVVGASLALLACLDLWWVHWRHVPTAPAALAEPTVPLALEVLREHASTRSDGPLPRLWVDRAGFGDAVVARASPVMARMDAALRASGTDPDWPAFDLFANLLALERLAPNSGVVHGLRYLNGEWSPLLPSRIEAADRVKFSTAPARSLARAGVGYVTTPHRRRLSALEGPGFESLATVPALDLRLLAVADPLPWARAVDDPRPATPSRGAGTAPAVPAVPAEILARPASVVAEALPGEPRWKPPASLAPADTVAVAHRAVGPGRHEIDVDSPRGPTLIVLTESWFAGWQATVDGGPVPLALADGRYMAAPVPAGRHTLVLRYRAPGLRSGALLTGLGLLLCIGALARGRSIRKDRGQREAAPARGS